MGGGDDFKISRLGELPCKFGERNFCFLHLGMSKFMFSYSFPPNFFDNLFFALQNFSHLASYTLLNFSIALWRQNFRVCWAKIKIIGGMEAEYWRGCIPPSPAPGICSPAPSVTIHHTLYAIYSVPRDT